MGSSFSRSSTDGAPASSPAGLGDLPENCLAIILSCLDPPEICKLAGVNRAFHRASSSGFIWESKLPENYGVIAGKLMFYERSYEGLRMKELYARLCSPILFSGGTKEVWMEKRGGGICMWVSWKGMKITGIDDRRYWAHISTIESRFHTVAYLQQIWWLEVEGDLEFEFPVGSYTLFFRLQLGIPTKGQNRQYPSTSKHVHGWSAKPVRFQFSVSDGQYATTECFLKNKGIWLQYRVGDFVIADSNMPTKIKFSMTQIDCTHQKGGLALDSVFICPNQLTF